MLTVSYLHLSCIKNIFQSKAFVASTLPIANCVCKARQMGKWRVVVGEGGQRTNQKSLINI